MIPLRELIDGDLDPVRAACVEIFAGRATHRWPPALEIPDGWREPYRASATDIDATVPLDVDEAAEVVRTFISEIDNSSCGDCTHP